MTSISLRGRPGGFSSSSARPRLIDRVKRIVQYRRILQLLVRRDLKVRYAGSALGYVWTVLDPLLMSLVYWFVFTRIFRRTVGYEPYVLFLVTGQIMWAWFNGGVLGTARSLRSEAQMVRSSNVPRELWVIRTVASKGVEFVFSLPVLALFALAYLKRPHIEVLLLPLGMLMCFTLTLALGLILAPLTVLIPDVERIVPIVLRLLFYAAPILYSVGNVPQSLRGAYQFNPTVGMLVLAHATFFPQELMGRTPVLRPNGRPVRADGHVVTHWVNHWNYVYNSAIGIAVLLAVGVFVFFRCERQVLKEI